MPDVLIDALMLSCPSQEAGKAAVNQFIEDLVEWRDLKKASWLQFFVSQDSHQLLADSDGYPSWKALRAIIQFYDLPIHERDVFEVVNAILSKVPAVEDFASVSSIEFETQVCDPSTNLTDRSPAFTLHYHKLLLLACILEREEICEIMPFIVTPGILGDRVQHVNFEARAVVQFNDGRKSTNGLGELRGVVGALTTVEALLSQFSPLDFWKEASGIAGCKLAIDVSVTRMARDLNMDTIRGWSFGSGFLDSAAKCGFFNQESLKRSLLRACAETILKTNLNSTHHLRESAGGASPQRLRNRDGAWRRDVDREYHLHYWETGCGPEFASVNVHNDMTIPC